MIGQRADQLRARPRIEPDGCYYLCLIMAAWLTGPPRRIIGYLDILSGYDALNATGAMRRTLVDDADGCFVLRAQSVVTAFGGSARYLGHESADYELAPDELAIERWVMPRPETGGLWGHFTLGPYDPWPGSITRREGRLDSLRVFRRG